jgi:glucose-6-phosphate dehydrogenase assembly protein OpcA
VAQAVSKTQEPESNVMWHGADVTVNEVMAALSGIRRKFAIEEAGDSEQPHPRNCVLTLVAVASTDAEERRAERACRIINAQHPAQAILVREKAEMKGGQIEAWISTQVQRPQTMRPFMCEVVTLHVRGAMGEHLAALLDPLLGSGVPTYLWWVGTPPFEKQEFSDALRICDALIVDSADFTAPYHSFLGLANLLTSAHEKLGVGDFQWARLRPWRESIAQFFAPAERRSLMQGINEVGMDYAGEGRGNRVAAAMMTGWLTSSLGWKLQQAAGGGGGIVSAHYVAEGWRPVDVHLRSVPKAHLAAGELSAVRIAGTSAGATFRLLVERDPERRTGSDAAVKGLIRPGGEDEAGLEISSRQAEWHRKNNDSLESMPIGLPLEEAKPKQRVVFTRERRRPDPSHVLLTLIEMGEGQPLRHVQQIEDQDEVALLLDILSAGTHDRVFVRSLTAASDLVRAF